MKVGSFKQHLLSVLVTLAAGGCGPAVSKPTHPPTAAHRRATSRESAPPPVVEKSHKAVVSRRGDWSLSSEKVAAVAELVAENSKKNNIPEDLLFGIIWVESRFDPRAVSPVGARGLMQLMPKTAKYLGDCMEWDGRTNAFDPAFNISAGSYYISRLIREFKGDENLALAAYNAGPTKVRRWLASGGLPDVSLAYASMVQTARSFFSRDGGSGALPGGEFVPRPEPMRGASAAPEPVITDEALDRLGLAILIAGFNAEEVTSLRGDDAHPFE